MDKLNVDIIIIVITWRFDYFQVLAKLKYKRKLKLPVFRIMAQYTNHDLIFGISQTLPQKH